MKSWINHFQTLINYNKKIYFRLSNINKKVSSNCTTNKILILYFNALIANNNKINTNRNNNNQNNNLDKCNFQIYKTKKINSKIFLKLIIKIHFLCRNIKNKNNNKFIFITNLDKIFFLINNWINKDLMENYLQNKCKLNYYLKKNIEVVWISDYSFLIFIDENADFLIPVLNLRIFKIINNFFFFFVFLFLLIIISNIIL